MAKVVVPLPDTDFDVTEVAVPWKLLRRSNHEVVFATEAGSKGPVPACDPLLLTGVVFGKLGARQDAIDCYRELRRLQNSRSRARGTKCESKNTTRCSCLVVMHPACASTSGVRRCLL